MHTLLCVIGVTCQIQERNYHKARFVILCNFLWYLRCTMVVVIQFVVDNAVRIIQRNFLVTERRKSDLMRLSLLIKTSTWHTISSVADVFGLPLRCLSSRPILPLSAPYPQPWPWHYICIVLSNLAVNFYRNDSLHTQKLNLRCIWRYLTKIPRRIPSLNGLCGNKTSLRFLSCLYNETDDLNFPVFGWIRGRIL